MSYPLFAAAAAMALSVPVWATGTPAAQGTPAKPAVPAAAPAKPAAPAKAADQLWFIAKAADGAIGYDAKSIKAKPELSTVDITSLIYLKKPGKTKSGALYNFILATDTLDCIGPQFKPGSRVVLDAAGKILDSGDAPANVGWGPIANNPPLNALRGVACSGASFRNLQQATSFAAALKTMKELK
jgi:hypothetical protein